MGCSSDERNPFCVLRCSPTCPSTSNLQVGTQYCLSIKVGTSESKLDQLVYFYLRRLSQVYPQTEVTSSQGGEYEMICRPICEEVI